MNRETKKKYTQRRTKHKISIWDMGRKLRHDIRIGKVCEKKAKLVDALLQKTEFQY